MMLQGMLLALLGSSVLSAPTTSPEQLSNTYCHVCWDAVDNKECMKTQQCDAEHTACLTTVNFEDGVISFDKRCARQSICWNMDENNVDGCYNADDEFSGSCHFCCDTPGCNKHLPSIGPAKHLNRARRSPSGSKSAGPLSGGPSAGLKTPGSASIGPGSASLGPGSISVGPGSKSAGPGSKSAGPGSASAGAKTPGSASAGAKTPGSASAGAKTPGSATAGAKTPGAATGGISIGCKSIGGISIGCKSSGSASVGSKSSGSASIGCTSIGGISIGCKSSGSASVGGKSSGSASVGGKSSGSASMGGKSSGSASVGGKSSGSASVGGKSSGSASMGGKSSGSASIGGKSSGSASMGGKSSGGISMGGSSGGNSNGGGFTCIHGNSVSGSGNSLGSLLFPGLQINLNIEVNGANMMTLPCGCKMPDPKPVQNLETVPPRMKTTEKMTMPPTTKMTTQAPAPATTKRTGPQCYICDGTDCNNQTLEFCPSGSDQCMNTVTQDKDGHRTFFKECVTNDICDLMWYQSTAGLADCFLLSDDSMGPPGLPLSSCSFCCHGVGCNEHAIPKDTNTWWQP